MTIPDDAGELDYANLSYSELIALESYRVAGAAIVDKAELLGVPLIITKVTFWKPNKDQMGMVSCEATIGDESALMMAVSRGWVPNIETRDKLKLKANERVVFNDGSTGVRRQLVSLFHNRSLIDVGTMTPEEIENNRAYDRPWPEWTSFSQFVRQSEEIGMVPCIARDHNNRPLVIRVDRGLSKSDYTNEYGESQTYYLR